MSLKVYIDTNVYLNSIENRDKEDFLYSEIEVLTPLEFYNEYME